MKRKLSVLVVIVASLALGVVAPSQAAQTAQAAPRSGSVVVDVSGPRSVPANVVLHRAGDKTSRVTVIAKSSKQTKRHVEVRLRPGTYTVRAAPVAVRGKRFNPRASRSRLRVIAGRTGRLTVRYAVEQGAHDLQVVAVQRSRAAFSWKSPRGTVVALRRAVGVIPPPTRFGGAAVSTAGSRALDLSLKPSTSYAYSLFTRVGGRWSGPQTVRLHTPGTSGASKSTYVLQPTARFLSAAALQTVTPSGSDIAVELHDGTSPVIGTALVLPPSSQLPAGYIGVVQSIAQDGRLVLAPGGLGDALAQYSLSVPAFGTTTSASVVRTTSNRAAGTRSAHVMKPADSSISVGSKFLKCEGDRPDVSVAVDRSLGLGGGFTFTGDALKGAASVDLSLYVEGSANLTATVSRATTCLVDLPSIDETVWAGPVPIGFHLAPIVNATIGERVHVKGIGATLRAGFKAHGTLALTDGHLRLTATSTPILTFAQSKPTIDARADIGLHLGGELLVGPGVASEVFGAVAGIEGTIDVVNGQFSIAASTDGSNGAACMRIAAGFTAGLYLEARAWLHLPLVDLDASAKVKLAALEKPIPYFSPLSVPAGCDPDHTTTEPSAGRQPTSTPVEIGAGSVGTTPSDPIPDPTSTPTTNAPLSSTLVSCMQTAWQTAHPGESVPESFSDSDVASVQDLTCWQPVDLTGLERFTGLQRLALPNFSGDLAAAAGLPALTSLRLSSLPLTALAPLRAAPRLTALSIDFPGGSDLSPISELTHLQDLTLTGTGDTSDFTPLGRLHDLRHFTLNATTLKDFRPLSAIHDAIPGLRLDITDYAQFFATSSPGDAETVPTILLPDGQRTQQIWVPSDSVPGQLTDDLVQFSSRGTGQVRWSGDWGWGTLAGSASWFVQ